MLRKSFLQLSALSIATLLCVSTISCGSSSSSTVKPCTGGPYNVVGDWNGTFMGSNGTTNAVGAIDSAGLAVFFDSTGDTAMLPAITGTCSFSGVENIYASFINGGGIISGTAQGNVNSATSITGTETVTGNSGTITLTPGTPLSASPIAITGTKTGETGGGGDFFTLAFTPAGSGSSMAFSGTDITSGCTVSGTLTQQATTNVFDVAYSISGASCTASSSTGIAFESNTDLFDFNSMQAGTYLYADIVGPSGAAVVEVF